MVYKDMNPECPRCRANGNEVARHGTYYRRCDARAIDRFRCKACRTTFSRATDTAAFRQKKRRINQPLMALLSACVSMRRAALLLNVSRSTVSRRLVYLGEQARLQEERLLDREAPVRQVQLDDLITLEHIKCKPLSVCVVVDSQRRLIQGFGVARIPASGNLAAISRKKYGKRPDESRQMREELFAEVQHRIHAEACFSTDGHDQYNTLIKRHFPESSHTVHPSKRGCVTGQGELKKVGFDPLFSINHTLAMLRANINRLVRRTWCTTKKPEALVHHLWIYVATHNRMIRQTLARQSPATE